MFLLWLYPNVMKLFFIQLKDVCLLIIFILFHEEPLNWKLSVLLFLKLNYALIHMSRTVKSTCTSKNPECSLSGQGSSALITLSSMIFPAFTDRSCTSIRKSVHPVIWVYIWIAYSCKKNTRRKMFKSLLKSNNFFLTYPQINFFDFRYYNEEGTLQIIKFSQTIQTLLLLFFNS